MSSSDTASIVEEAEPIAAPAVIDLDQIEILHHQPHKELEKIRDGSGYAGESSQLVLWLRLEPGGDTRPKSFEIKSPEDLQLDSDSFTFHTEFDGRPWSRTVGYIRH